METRYAGTWRLMPELSFYEQGDSPASGLYVIEVDADRVNFAVSWTDAAGTEHEAGYGGLVGTGTHEVSGAAGVTASFEHVAPGVLDSSTFAGGHRIAYSRRRVSDDGSLLAVLQVTWHPDGRETRATQVYRRDA
ncbi:hypothetical protein [Demequina sp.]|uniref:hypothetical protein n=1 Tax=Demequina sp. TaxID=2050685 RepID=UPI0025DD8E43|nr:hypothetical protein [Demequina sp.]